MGNPLQRSIAFVGGLCQFLALIGCAAGSGGGGSTPPPPPPPTISILAVGAYYGQGSVLNLEYAIAGQGSFLLLLEGSGFTSTAVVEWNGSALPTQFAGSTNVDAPVPSALIASPRGSQHRCDRPRFRGHIFPVHFRHRLACGVERGGCGADYSGTGRHACEWRQPCLAFHQSNRALRSLSIQRN